MNISADGSKNTQYFFDILSSAEWQDEAICLAAVMHDGLLLKIIKEPSLAVQMAAVTQNWRALEYAFTRIVYRQVKCVRSTEYIESELIKQDQLVCLTAINKNGLAIEFVKKQTPELCMAAVMQTGMALKVIRQPNDIIEMLAVMRDGWAIQFVRVQTEELCMAAVTKDWDAIVLIKNPSDAVIRESINNSSKMDAAVPIAKNSTIQALDSADMQYPQTEHKAVNHPTVTRNDSNPIDDDEEEVVVVVGERRLDADSTNTFDDQYGTDFLKPQIVQPDLLSVAEPIEPPLLSNRVSDGLDSIGFSRKRLVQQDLLSGIPTLINRVDNQSFSEPPILNNRVIEDNCEFKIEEGIAQPDFLSGKNSEKVKRQVRKIKLLKSLALKPDFSKPSAAGSKWQNSQAEWEAVEKKAYALSEIEMQTPELCLFAVTRYGMALQFVKNKTPEICLAACKGWGAALMFVNKPTEEMCLAAVMQYGRAITYVSKQTEEIKLAAVQNDPKAVKFIRGVLSEAVQVAAVKQEPMIIEFIKNPCLLAQQIAVEKNTLALKCIEWIADEVAIAAVKLKPGYIRFIKNQSVAVCMAAIEQDHKVSRFITLKSAELDLALVSKNGLALQHISNKTDAICLAAVRQNPKSVKFINPLQEKLLLAAIMENWLAIQYIDNPTARMLEEAINQNVAALKLIKDVTLAMSLAAVRKNGLALEFVKVQTDAICIAAVKQNPDAIQFVRKKYLDGVFDKLSFKNRKAVKMSLGMA